VSEKTAGEIIATVVASGLSRAQIARAIGCSRMHLWRIERGEIGENSRVSKLVKDNFDSAAQPNGRQQVIEREALGAIRAIVRNAPEKSDIVLQMLRLVQLLATKSDAD
jgi:hypothetical protein